MKVREDYHSLFVLNKMNFFYETFSGIGPLLPIGGFGATILILKLRFDGHIKQLLKIKKEFEEGIHENKKNWAQTEWRRAYVEEVLVTFHKSSKGTRSVRERVLNLVLENACLKKEKAALVEELVMQSETVVPLQP